ncbi:uncharacterized protein LOC131845445 [Achroia grisella]|uniref:uncharacterized protein LOC131845445 n=1 Tax=Achroia grisella TaxID=688607 RepID=UPI0027D34B3F|nr:uncharacterized protein LOC131845445 [Achroia grisella]
MFIPLINISIEISSPLYSNRESVFAVPLYLLLISMATPLAKYRKPLIKYPKDTQFWATDFFVRGCRNFLENCPSSYKTQFICARNYNGDFEDFSNYCEMQYENCNTWKNWQVFKRERC